MEIRITVADVIYPAPGKKQGRIIDQTGKTWQVWGDKMSGYSRGGNYVISKYKTSEFKGQTYYTIEEVSPVGQMPGMANPVSAPASIGVSPSDTERRMDIFVCGAFNNIMANPNVNPALLEAADMINLVKRLKATWVNTLGPNRPGTTQRAAQNSDLNDDLPDGF